MNDTQKPQVFLAWAPYQRRVDAFRDCLNILPCFVYYPWENRSKAHKLFSYFVKTVASWRILRKHHARTFYVQAPPIFPVCLAWFYAVLFKARYIVDAHNSMIDGSGWARLPFARTLMARAAMVLVHNEAVSRIATQRGIAHAVLMDRPPDVDPASFPFPAAIVRDRERPRVVVPGSFDSDEPLDQLLQATRALPDVDFYLTWFPEKLPAAYRDAFGDNVILTGFLDIPDFDALLAHANVVLVLTNREGTQPSGATEALAFRKPLVVSDIRIVRELFPAGAVYVANEGAAIAAGIRTALRDGDRLAGEMASFRRQKIAAWEEQLTAVEAAMECSAQREED